MTLDLRSLTEWLGDLVGRGRLSGGGPFGTARFELSRMSPTLDPEDL